MIRTLLVLAAAGTLASAQDTRKEKGKPDRTAVDDAIDKGVAQLRTAADATNDRVELVLWTFLHAGIRENDPDVQKMLKTVLNRKMEKTYAVALQAMILEELDRVRYQPRIATCAQFLIDNQCKNGQWNYGEADAFAAPVATAAGAKDVPSSGAKLPSGQRKKPKVVRKVAVKKMKDGPPTGDSSNSQYAALGLRACHDAGIVLPRDVVELARKAWRESTHGNEGTKESGEAKGWGYYGPDFKGSYGAMTVGGLSSLCVYQYILGEPWMKDPSVEAARNWLTINFSVSETPKASRGWDGYESSTALYYYLYGLERSAMLYGSETFGTHSWYSEGARVILDSQRSDGSWNTANQKDDSGPVANTCFAILFLRRATQPLTSVASEDRYINR